MKLLSIIPPIIQQFSKNFIHFSFPDYYDSGRTVPVAPVAPEQYQILLK